MRTIDTKQNLFLILQHFCFFCTCDGIFFNEFQSAQSLVDFTFGEVDCRESSTSKVLQQLKIRKMESIIVRFFLNQNRLNRKFFYFFRKQNLEFGLFIIQSQTNSMIIWDGIEANDSNERICIFLVFYQNFEV